MYNFKELSESLEISRQTVYNYLKDYSNELKEHIVKKKGTTYIDDEGLNLIKVKMGLIKVPTIQENDISIDNIVDNIVKSLKEELEVQNNDFMEQYELKLDDVKQELEEVKEQNKELLELMKLSQTKKKSWLSRIFNK